MKELFSSPLFGVLISLVAFELGLLLYNKTKVPIFNPLFVAIIIVIIFLLKFNISLDSYNRGGTIISFFLGPATVILAVPLYKKIKLLKENALAILTGITLGSIVSMVSIIFLSKIFGIEDKLKISLMPKSVTVPIGVEIAKILGGLPPITTAAIVTTGIMGAIIGPFVCKIFRIKDKVAIGVAIGTASHAVGTTKAMELGETEGAMSGLSIGIAGLITVILAPIIVKLL